MRSGRRCWRTFRWAGWGLRKTSRRPSLSWPRLQPAIFREPPCTSTAECTWHNRQIKFGRIARFYFFRASIVLRPNFKRGSAMDNVQRVIKVVAEQLGVNEADIKNESSFVGDLGADSLDTVELVMALEEEFGCEIPDEDAEKITTVQQAIDYVNSHSS